MTLQWLANDMMSATYARTYVRTCMYVYIRVCTCILYFVTQHMHIDMHIIHVHIHVHVLYVIYTCFRFPNSNSNIQFRIPYCTSNLTGAAPRRPTRMTSLDCIIKYLHAELEHVRTYVRTYVRARKMRTSRAMFGSGTFA